MSLWECCIRVYQTVNNHIYLSAHEGIETFYCFRIIYLGSKLLNLFIPLCSPYHLLILTQINSPCLNLSKTQQRWALQGLYLHVYLSLKLQGILWSILWVRLTIIRYIWTLRTSICICSAFKFTTFLSLKIMIALRVFFLSSLDSVSELRSSTHFLSSNWPNFLRMDSTTLPPCFLMNLLALVCVRHMLCLMYTIMPLIFLYIFLSFLLLWNL